ncbi:peptidylprolyl isomerase [Lacinutrix sp. 5H-3-7-4]|uniref:peptidylprolyl isomerase n=1 Tax=Lacinutrix sp. (strain 5H-3-7-4) TaxID=983544 RepID=UPI001ED8C928|nr:peptidylprolyl isomerase [Lacinutrix sp. 5H-3-7-4]
MKYITALSLSLFAACSMQAQEIIEEKEEKTATIDSVKPFKEVKVDGVAAVVGEYIVLDSDVDKTILQLKASGNDISQFTNCELFGRLLEDKLYAHHAIQDSIVVSDAEIRSYVNQQVERFRVNFKTEDEMLKFYKKDNIKALTDEMFEINKANKLASEMQRKIVDEIEVTPEEVRQYFSEIPDNEKPTFGTELKVAQIVIEPKVTPEAEQEVIDRLNEFKKDVEENGASFSAKALFNSADTGSKRTGGRLPTMNRAKPQMVKEFREATFSLQEGEISEPFKTEFGWHIVYLEKIRGQEYDARHILLIPEISDEAKAEAKEKLEGIRQNIIDGDITFAEAAKEASDEIKTKYEGGLIRNPETQDFTFPLAKMPTEIYTEIENLETNEVSKVVADFTRTGNVKYKIYTVSDRIDEHKADFSRDFLKIKELALNEKRLNAIAKWQKEKIEDTYIKIGGEYKNCEFTNNWLKK